jgi:hypothetical protein
MPSPDDRPMAPSPFRRFFLAAVSTVLGLALLAAAVLPLAAPATPAPAISFEAEAEAADEEFEDEEWEIEDEEEEEEEAFEAADTAGPTALPPECVLRTADASAVALRDRLLLTLRYTSETPTKAGVEYWLKGDKGSLQVASTERHLGKRGVLRLSRHLDERERAKVEAAKVVLLRLDLPQAESHCKRFLIFRLATKHRRGGRTTWSEYDRVGSQLRSA